MTSGHQGYMQSIRLMMANKHFKQHLKTIGLKTGRYHQLEFHQCKFDSRSKHLNIYSWTKSMANVLKLPTRQPSFPIKPSPQLRLRLQNLTLQNSILDNILTLLRLHTREPNTLRSTLLLIILCLVLLLIPLKVSAPVHNYIGRVLVAADMANEVDSHAAGA